MSRKTAEMLLVLVTLGWGSSYMFMKQGLGSIEEFNLIALRFGIAFAVMMPLLIYRRKHIKRSTLAYGGLLGMFLFLLFTFLHLGLKTTSTSNAAFLLSLTVIFVPVIKMISSKEIPNRFVITGMFFAITGTAFLTLEGGLRLQAGDGLCILSSLAMSFQILLNNKAVHQVDPVSMGIIQLGTTALLGLIFSLAFETPSLPHTSDGWISVFALAIICSSFGFIVQSIAQKHTTASRTSIIFSLQPLFAALFGFLLLSETFSLEKIAGSVLIFLGVIITGKNSSKEQCSLDVLLEKQ